MGINYLSLAKTLKTFALDTLFPISCIKCQKDGHWLCDTCLHEIELLSFQVCPKCEKTITQSGLLCQDCKPFDLDGLLACTRYKESGVDKLVHLYKYRFIEDLHVPLGKMMAQKIIISNLPLPDMLIPVPLHPRRLRWRGFNQAGLLAIYLGKNITTGLDTPVCENLLIRKKSTQPQMKIKKSSERRNNLKDAFNINPKESANHPLRGKTIMLIDDIATTGATLFECARVLKRNGAKKVFAVVVARQS